MIRSTLLPLAVLVAGIGGAAQAATAVAVPAAPAKVERVVVGESLWARSGDSFRTASLSARPAIACAQVVQKLGAVTSFEVDGVALAADDLAKCNARAKGGATALARN